MPSIAKGIYGRAFRSANSKDKLTCNACSLKSINGSIENRGIIKPRCACVLNMVDRLICGICG